MSEYLIVISVYLVGVLLMLVLIVWYYSYAHDRKYLLRVIKDDVARVAVASVLWFVILPAALAVSMGAWLAEKIQTKTKERSIK